MWSWAVTMVFAGTGELPFKGESLMAAAFAILHSEPNVGTLPEPLRSLVHRCLSRDPAVRPSARGALAELVAAGARLVGPMPPVASAPATYEEAATSVAAPEPRQGSGDGLIGVRPATRSRSTRRRRSRTWRRRRTAVLVAMTVLVAVAGVVALNLPRHGAPAERLAGRQVPNSQELAAEEAARTEAVTWILQQVSRAAIVSCDPQVCTNLASKGFPSGNLLTLGPGSTDPLGSALVVATAAIRAQFGGRLASVYAPAVIASFGSGNARIDIRLVFPGGAAGYRAVQQTALRTRKAADAQLLGNSHIAVSATARAQLLGGDIDPRLPLLLAIMAHSHQVRIVDFVSQSPGGGPASLLRSVDLATVDPAAHLTRAAYLGWMQAFVIAQTALYSPAWTQQVTLRTGQTVLRIGYGAPSPLS
jgi:hypothetical protein